MSFRNVKLMAKIVGIEKKLNWSGECRGGKPWPHIMRTKAILPWPAIYQGNYSLVVCCLENLERQLNANFSK